MYSKAKNHIQVHVKIDKLESHMIELEKLGGQNSACLELVCNAVIDNSHFDTQSCNNVRYFFLIPGGFSIALHSFKLLKGQVIRDVILV